MFEGRKDKDDGDSTFLADSFLLMEDVKINEWSFDLTFDRPNESTPPPTRRPLS